MVEPVLHPQQRGFVRGRDIVDSVTQLEARIAGYSQLVVGPFLAGILLGVKQAFPSLLHDWM